MADDDGQQARLTQLTTQWTMIFRAHTGTPEDAAAAQVDLMDRYSGAIQRYLLAAVRDPEIADDLNQEFALRFLRGDFHRADPSRGRFRDFVKRALHNLVTDHWRRQKTRPRPLGDALPDRADPSAPDPDFDRRFVESWREAVLARTWNALLALERQSGQPYHTVLALRVRRPELRSPELAELLTAKLGRPIAAGALRMALQRARDRFVGFLLEEVAAGLTDPTPEEVESELIELGLHGYVKPAGRSSRSK